MQITGPEKVTGLRWNEGLGAEDEEVLGGEERAVGWSRDGLADGCFGLGGGTG